ncbi:Glycoside hydrolase family 3 [Penicillium cf. viridicatum]|uniref:beta-glucosidase n=1 Tax=Penicillium cf. viridicatum TaxID=2972119 RepID=A0A9W9N5I2_9EURO|nr:Glycoside hydrolase family 3 [Penicillium cf. viridicatum]
MDASRSILSDFDVSTVLSEATVAEKVGLISGVPSIRFTDGLNGVRGTRFTAGVRAACLPCDTALGATWNQALIREGGVLIGMEVKAKGARVWLGPTVNIQRSPLGGRNFESFAEDPFLSGKIAGSYISGAQSAGIVSTLKHFVANDQEHERMAVDVPLKEGQPGGIVASYNKVNGLHVSESPALLEDVLRREWRFKGMIMSDWYGTYSTVEAMNAGLDLEMPGPPRLRGILADLAVSSRKVSHAILDTRARNVLNLVRKCAKIEGVSSVECIRDTAEDRATNRQLAGESIVLLKNDSGILPIPSDEVEEIALIGPNLKNGAYCGGGSAQLDSYYVVTNYEGIVDRLTNNGQRKDVKINYEIGVHSWGFLPLLGSQVTSPDGRVGGLRMCFFSEPPSNPHREVVDIMDITNSTWQLMGYSHPKLGPQFWADAEGTFCTDETGDYEWGIACCGTASLFIDGTMIIDNTTIQQPGNSFFGRGSTEKKAVTHIEGGQNYQIKLQFGSLPTSKIYKEGVVAYGSGAGCIGVWPVSKPDKAIARAAALARKCKYTIVCVVLDVRSPQHESNHISITKELESEGYDRPTMNLPEPTGRLIAGVLDANPDAIIVTQSGAPINMQPWVSWATTLAHMWYGGNEMGNGLADVLFGDINPSGKLPLTFPNAIEDTPAFLNFESERGRTVYGEGVYIGYRYYEKLKRSVSFPFGHGLSYTEFEFSELSVSQKAVSLCVHNTGSVTGATVVQVYISPSPANTISRPMKELKGFAKVFLEPSESQDVVIGLDRLSTSFWDETLGCWLSEKGIYGVHVGQSSADIVLSGSFEVKETTTWIGLDI